MAVAEKNKKRVEQPTLLGIRNIGQKIELVTAVE